MRSFPRPAAPRPPATVLSASSSPCAGQLPSAATVEVSAAAILEGCEEELLSVADVHFPAAVLTSPDLRNESSCDSDTCEVISPDVSVHQPDPADATIAWDGPEMSSLMDTAHAQDHHHAIRRQQIPDFREEHEGEEQAGSTDGDAMPPMLCTPKPKRRRAKTQPRLKSPLKTPMKTSQSRGSLQKQRSEPSRSKSSAKAAPRRSPLQELNAPATRNRSSGRRSQRPAWDFTSSDMSRYKLSPAEHLRRQLLRISRHRDEAAVQFHQRLRSMQENLTPFLYETQRQSSADVPSASTKGPAHMTPCFASRVPTGRIPQEPQAARGITQRSGFEPDGHELMTRCSGGKHERSDGFIGASSHEQSLRSAPHMTAGRTGHHEVATRTRRTRQHDSALDEDVRLTAALEAEIQNFFTDVEKASDSNVSHNARNSTPQYRFLKRKQQSQVLGKATVHCSASGYNQSQSNGTSNGDFSAQRSPPINSDSELDELEADAGQLEAQLEWWRKHEKIVGGSSPSSLISQDAELDGCSEWLRLSSASRGRSFSLASTGNVAKQLFQASPNTGVGALHADPASQQSDDGVSRVPSLPTFERLDLQALVQKQDDSYASTADCADSSFSTRANETGKFHTTASCLSELVLRQAKDLVDSTMSASNLPELDGDSDSFTAESAKHDPNTSAATCQSTSILSVTAGSATLDQILEAASPPASKRMTSTYPQLQFDTDKIEHKQEKSPSISACAGASPVQVMVDVSKPAGFANRLVPSVPELAPGAHSAVHAPTFARAALPCVRWQGADEAENSAVTVVPEVKAIEQAASAMVGKATASSFGADPIARLAPSSAVKTAANLMETVHAPASQSKGADLPRTLKPPAAVLSQRAEADLGTGPAKKSWGSKHSKQVHPGDAAAATLALAREWAAEIASATDPRLQVTDAVQNQSPTETVGKAMGADASLRAKEVPTRLEIRNFDELFNM